jgi:flagellar biosynthesis component FlhA
MEPTFGLPATWVDAALRDEAQLKGLQELLHLDVVEEVGDVGLDHLGEVGRDHGGGVDHDEAQLKGYTVVDAATVVSTHLTEVIKAHVSDLLSAPSGAGRAAAPGRPSGPSP